MNRLKIACIQTNTGPDLPRNITALRGAILEARQRGAELIATPENSDAMKKRGEPEQHYAERDHPLVLAFSAWAKETGAWLLAGSVAVAAADGKRFNRSLLFNSAGDVAARYDKIHLFAYNGGPGETYNESETVQPGGHATLAQTPWGKLGLTICYDLRFAALYRSLAQAGASIITVPAAFTTPTGQAHWHVLLRARAIETGCFIVAPGQCGEHDGGRKTYGHSLIVSPWGEILADGGKTPGIVMADLDLGAVAEARRALPSLEHDRPFALASIK